MKSIITPILLLILCLTQSGTFAQQIPNGGFEAWTNTSYGEVPQGSTGMPWVTNDSLVSILNGITPNKAIKKVTDAHSGTYALCIQESYIYIPSNGYMDSAGGVIFLGQADFSTFSPYGVSYTARPVSVSGYYKITANISGADTGRISATFKKNGAVIGEAEGLFSGNVASYQQFTIPINWTSTDQPDKLEFFMDNGGVDKVSNDTSTRFYVDDVIFELPNGVQENLLANEGVQIYPNPATDKIVIQLSDALSAAGNYLTIHNVEGKQIQQLAVQKSQAISLRDYASGVYFLQLHEASGKLVYGTRINVVH